MQEHYPLKTMKFLAKHIFLSTVSYNPEILAVYPLIWNPGETVQISK